MSSSNRVTTKAGKKSDSDKKKTDGKADGKGSGGGGGKTHMSAQEIRQSQTDDPMVLKEKIKSVCEVTLLTEDEVVLALHDNDYNVDLTINAFIEGSQGSNWKTSAKKKKNRQPAAPAEQPAHVTAPVQDADDTWGDTDKPAPNVDNHDRKRDRGAPRARGSRENTRGWRGRENRENERNQTNQDDNARGDGFKPRGRISNGPRTGRGGRGARANPGRAFPPKDPASRQSFTKPIDTWNADTTQKKRGANDNFPEPEEWNNDEYRSLGNQQPPKIDTWGFPHAEDWDNEEYTGSLADTKVFTPSGQLETSAAPTDAKEPVADDATVTPEVHAAPVAAQQLAQALELRGSAANAQTQPQSNTLTAAQSQYLSQLTQQSQAERKPGYQASTYASTANYNANYLAGSYDPSVQQTSNRASTKVQRARVPPPSKIPSSAVEMPGDAIDYVDVQFGGLDLDADGSYENNELKYAGLTEVNGTTYGTTTTASFQANNLDMAGMDVYNSSVKPPSASVVTQQLAQSQLLTNTDLQMQSSDHAYKSTSSSVPSTGVLTSSSTNAATELASVKPAPDMATYASAQQTAQTAANSAYQYGKLNSSAYQTPISFNPSSAMYSTTQPQANTATLSASNQNSSVYNQASNQSSAQSNANNYVSSTQTTQSMYHTPYQTSSYSTSSSGVPSIAYNPNNVITPNTMAFASSMSGSTNSSSVSAFNQSLAAAQVAAAQAAAAAAAQNQSYPANANQSVYAAAVLNSANAYPNQYNSYTSGSNSKMSGSSMGSGNKDAYDTTSTANSSTTSAQLSALSTQTTAASGKSGTTTTAKNSVVPNMPPGVPPMIGTQYIMGQTGMPAFYQNMPQMYQYEDLQLLPRIPQMTTGYYDMSYQTPTTLATPGDQSLRGVPGYSISDARFSNRADNNASPVPSSTIAQQATTQAHQTAQPMINAATIPPYTAYFYNAGMMPGNFPYGTPIYPMAQANAHGSSTTSQYAKPGSYASTYASQYDSLTQSQDYTKNAYAGTASGQAKTSAGTNAAGNNTAGSGAATTQSSTGADLTSAMYAKSHVALGKVNSYEKQGFHSGTPPPFNLTGNQSGGMAPSAGQYAAPQLFIPTMPAPHHSAQLIHQPMHQDSGNNSRSQTSTQAKPGSKQPYQASYWNQA